MTIGNNAAAQRAGGDGTRQPWDAEIELTAEDATLLIEEQFPGLAAGGATLLGRGWDNTAFVTRRTRAGIATRPSLEHFG